MEYRREPHLLRDATQQLANPQRAKQIYNDPNLLKAIEIAKHFKNQVEDYKAKGKEIKEQREVAKRNKLRS